MSKEERYDVVIIGAGHNGTTTAAYLSKCGLSVCLLEDRPECGGAQETCEPRAGMRIQPHAIANYGGSAPGWEQLELWKYGFRMDWKAGADVPLDLNRFMLTSDGLSKVTDKDKMGWGKICGMLTDPPFFKDLMRANFWCPPHPPGVEVNEHTIPYMQVYKQHQPDMWTRELLEMTMFDVMDEYLETEPFKVNQAYIALVSGAHGHMEGVAIPAVCSVATVLPPAVANPVAPRGNIHGYYHALLRCAIAHGAVVRTCCPVEEIIIEHGRAIGVRLRDDATWSAKKIWADKAVISAVHIKPTFLEMVGPRHLDKGFLQRIKDLSLKGGSLYMTHYLTRERLRLRPKFRREDYRYEDYGSFMGPFFPMDSRQVYFDHVADVLGHQRNLRIPPEKALFGMVAGELYDQTHPQCTRPGLHINGPQFMMVPTPEYNIEGLEAMEDKKKWNEYMRVALSQVVENLDYDNIVEVLGESPLEQEFRNTGMLGGSWYGIRHDRDQWWNERPLPELARYRTPIERLYLSHQSSAHPGGLCLMAVGYNLMHILIEDGIAEPGDWWYASPWYIPEDGKVSAIPTRPSSVATR
ncbi:MAG: NAD(P)/FAD-dependent oxidoreductase [Dehalococcoidia bacterium]|nr:NAD(P)/FAD-dependent oxidoreductase [Dehalococcoidia bacterium]